MKQKLFALVAAVAALISTPAQAQTMPAPKQNNSASRPTLTSPAVFLDYLTNPTAAGNTALDNLRLALENYNQYANNRLAILGFAPAGSTSLQPVEVKRGVAGVCVQGASVSARAQMFIPGTSPFMSATVYNNGRPAPLLSTAQVPSATKPPLSTSCTLSGPVTNYISVGGNVPQTSTEMRLSAAVSTLIDSTIVRPLALYDVGQVGAAPPPGALPWERVRFKLSPTLWNALTPLQRDVEVRRAALYLMGCGTEVAVGAKSIRAVYNTSDDWELDDAQCVNDYATLAISSALGVPVSDQGFSTYGGLPVPN